MTTRPPAPARFCAVIPMENGTYEAYCIACRWSATSKSRAVAERRAKRHECPRRR